MQNCPVSPEHRKTYTNSVSKSIKQYRTNFFLGTFGSRTTSTTHRYDDDDSSDDADNLTTTRTYIVEFLVGFTISRKGLRVMTTDTFDNYMLDVIRRRPYSSEIFILCRKGDAGAVKRLLDRVEASIYDVDEDGMSLLHKAASHPKLCQILPARGADVYLRDDYDALFAKQSESFILMCEIGGYDPWHSYGPRAIQRNICDDISV
ncbi:hypothetical protein sscle_15g103030 [Sclerotinia sclerotiorum 1980 UF-70]|uniref:Ankyrin repeat protein n=1 Tax=Sclerotinia sclerotiorum (strain ATCC 18683 / 1980 / Ss-1) TaxID=665079 RepID=A0A1D9QLS3_SCLS1|nr:hypothetical protein sscle_15g103030 [Sclerotinia sclerotiorum 1980 UF-70]